MKWSWLILTQSILAFLWVTRFWLLFCCFHHLDCANCNLHDSKFNLKAFFFFLNQYQFYSWIGATNAWSLYVILDRGKVQGGKGCFCFRCGRYHAQRTSCFCLRCWVAWAKKEWAVSVFGQRTTCCARSAELSRVASLKPGEGLNLALHPSCTSFLVFASLVHSTTFFLILSKCKEVVLVFVFLNTQSALDETQFTWSQVLSDSSSMMHHLMSEEA